MMTKTDLAEIINWVLTTVLIIAIVLAVQQRYFEEKKCMLWAEDRIFEIRSESTEDTGFYCNMQCTDSMGYDFNASTMQTKRLAEEQDYPQLSGGLRE